MTIEELQTRCAYWQKMLRLQDWDISVSMVRQWEIPDSWGNCEPHLSKKIAKIKILDKVDEGEPDCFEVYDPEKTLVHELLHVHFESFATKDDEGTPVEVAQHQVIHALAGALVTLVRGGE